MTTIEDRLRELMAEQTAAPRLDGEPYAHVERRIGRIRRQRAAGAGAAVAGVALGVAALVLPGGGGDPSPATPRPEPSAGTVLATIVPARPTGDPAGRPTGRATVTAPANGMTVRVDCRRPTSDAVAVYLGGRWFTGVDCASPANEFAPTYAVRPADYARFGMRAGRPVAVTVSTDGQRPSPLVRVEAGPPALAREPVPEPTAPPATDGGPGRIVTVLPGRGHTDKSVDVPFTLPSGSSRSFGVRPSCTGPGRLAATVLGPRGETLATADTASCGLLEPSGDGYLLDNTTLQGFGVHPGDGLTLRVVATGFDHPTWRVDVVEEPEGDGAAVSRERPPSG